MYYDKSKTELIGIVLEKSQEIEDLKQQRDFYRKKFAQCNEWGGYEEYVLKNLGIDKKLN
jgi:hypothetical protein